MELDPLLENPQEITVQGCIKNLQWVVGDGIQGSSILAEFRTMGIAMENPTPFFQKSYLICLLVAADLAGSDEFTLEVFHHYHIIFQDKVSIVLQA